MESDAVAGPPRPALPPVGAFLREMLSLGVASIRPALPALVFLCFYRFGMGLFFEFAQGTSPLGYPDERVQLVHLMMSLCAYLPLLVLVYLPFLPLQDAIRRGERRTFLESTRLVLERFPAFLGSGITQLVILLGPLFVFLAAAFAIGEGVNAASDTIPREVALSIILVVLAPAICWILFASAFLVFATPAVILDERGPLASVRGSVRLVWRNFWGLQGRFLVWFLLLVLAIVVMSFPTIILAIAGAVAGADPPPLKIARVLWTSAVTAASFPFCVSAMMALYRSLVPGSTPGPAPGPPGAVGAAPTPEPPDPGASPQIFE
ncbi:MAG TPA: hypothetical protein VF363_05970 [Candidatus Eisenbacteria bacterium]